jgi:tail collar domain
MKIRNKLAIVVAGIAATLALGSIAWAAIPDIGGTVHGCYDKASGQLRVTDPQSNTPKACSGKEAALDWNLRGIQGLPGPQGPAGPAGAPGADPTADAFVRGFGTDVGNAAAATGAECTLGQVLLTASTLKTAGGVPANGQLLPIAQNAALFALLGTTYGGDGKSTFALPDLRSITPNHMTYSICIFGSWPA